MADESKRVKVEIEASLDVDKLRNDARQAARVVADELGRSTAEAANSAAKAADKIRRTTFDRRGADESLQSRIANIAKYQQALRDFEDKALQRAKDRNVQLREEIKLTAARLQATRQVARELRAEKDADPGNRRAGLDLSRAQREIETLRDARRVLTEQLRKDNDLRRPILGPAPPTFAQQQAAYRAQQRAFEREQRASQQFADRRQQAGLLAYTSLRQRGIGGLFTQFAEGDLRDIFTTREGKFAGLGSVLSNIAGGGGAGFAQLATALGKGGPLATAIGVAAGGIGLLAGAITTLGSAVVNAYTNANQYLGQIARLQRLTGQSTQAAVGLQALLASVGKEDDPFATITLTQIQANIAKVRQGGKLDNQAQAFEAGSRALGIDPRSTQNINQFLLRLSETTQALSATERSLRIQQIAGLFGSDIANFAGYDPKNLRRLLDIQTNVRDADLRFQQDRAVALAESTQALKNFELALTRSIGPIDIFAERFKTVSLNSLTSLVESIQLLNGNRTLTQSEREKAKRDFQKLDPNVLRLSQITPVLGPLQLLDGGLGRTNYDGQVKSGLATKAELEQAIAAYRNGLSQAVNPLNKIYFESRLKEYQDALAKLNEAERKEAARPIQRVETREEFDKRIKEEAKARQEAEAERVKGLENQLSGAEKVRAATLRLIEAENQLTEAVKARNQAVANQITSELGALESQADAYNRSFERYAKARQRQETLEDLADDVVAVRPSANPLTRKLARARSLERQSRRLDLSEQRNNLALQRGQNAIERAQRGDKKGRVDPLRVQSAQLSQQNRELTREFLAFDRAEVNAELNQLRRELGATGPLSAVQIGTIYRKRGLSKAEQREQARLLQELEAYETGIDEATVDRNKKLLNTYLSSSQVTSKSAEEFNQIARESVQLFTDIAAADGQFSGVGFNLALAFEALNDQVSKGNISLAKSYEISSGLSNLQKDFADVFAGVKDKLGKPVEIEIPLLIKNKIITQQEAKLAEDFKKNAPLPKNEFEQQQVLEQRRQAAQRLESIKTGDDIVREYLKNNQIDIAQGIQASLDLKFDDEKLNKQVDEAKKNVEKARKDLEEFGNKEIVFEPLLRMIAGQIDANAVVREVDKAINNLSTQLGSKRVVVVVRPEYQINNPSVVGAVPAPPPQTVTPVRPITGTPTIPPTQRRPTTITPTPPPGSRGPQYNLPQRRFGGPTDKDRVYLVGETGPELFIPPVDGYVLNAAQTNKLIELAQKAVRPPVNLAELQTQLFSRFEQIARQQINRQIYRGTSTVTSLRDALALQGIGLEEYARRIKEAYSPRAPEAASGGGAGGGFGGGDGGGGGGGVDGGGTSTTDIVRELVEDRSYDSIEDARARRLNSALQRVISRTPAATRPRPSGSPIVDRYNESLRRAQQEAERAIRNSDRYRTPVRNGNQSGRLASGGPVRAGQPYIVGDALGRGGSGGREAFLPAGVLGGVKAAPGVISSISFSDNRTLTVQASGGDGRRIARAVVNAARGFLSDTFAVQQRDFLRRQGKGI